MKIVEVTSLPLHFTLDGLVRIRGFVSGACEKLHPKPSPPHSNAFSQLCKAAGRRKFELPVPSDGDVQSSYVKVPFLFSFPSLLSASLPSPHSSW
eukprot:761217-Hanusia_phi.AAC.3